MNLEQHIKILGIVHIISGALGVLIAGLVFVLLVLGGLLSQDAGALAITSGVGIFVALIIAFLSAPGIIGGIGLLKHKSWSRILVMILGCLNLLSVPIGTLIGIYSLWVLTRPESSQMLSR